MNSSLHRFFYNFTFQRCLKAMTRAFHFMKFRKNAF